MAWQLDATLIVPSADLGKFLTLELVQPNQYAQAVVYYVPDTPIPASWARVGWYSLGGQIEDEFVWINSGTINGPLIDGSPSRMFLDYGPFYVFQGEVQNFDSFWLAVSIVDYAPPGVINVEGFV
jgi:hypothetical protein